MPRTRAPGVLAVMSCSVILASAGAADIQVSMLSDIELGTVAPTTGELQASSELCVSLSEPGRYSVTARGEGRGGEFRLNNGVSSLPLGVYYSDRRDRRGVRLDPGVPLAGQKGKKRKPRRNCNRLNASVTIVIAAADLEASSSGGYRGTLTLTVAPE